MKTIKTFFQCIKMYIITLMVNCFNCKVKIDSRKIKRSMLSYFHYEEWGYETSITKVEVYKRKNSLQVIIETHRPGLLIGKGGRFIDGLKDWLENNLKTNITINLYESKLWFVWR